MESDRIYQNDNDLWYFNVRGNQAMGPYANYHEASDALAQHVSGCRSRLSGNRLWSNLAAPFRVRRRPSAAPRHT